MASLPSNKGKVAIIGRYFLGLLPGGKTPLYKYRYKYMCIENGQRFSPWAEIQGLSCKNNHLSQLLSTRDIWPGGTSEPQLEKFYPDDVKSVRNLVSSSDWSAYLIFIHCIVLAIVYKQQTKDRQSQRSNVNVMNLLQISQCSWNIFSFRSSII